ncbi:MAG: DNA repair protein RecO [Pseudomonadota bacterium]
MDWRDEGILLHAREHGESACIIDVLTMAHGRHAGLVHGGKSARLGASLQPGAQLSLEWRARIEDHLGTFKPELIKSRAGLLMENRAALAAFNSMAALLITYAPEREPDFELYEASSDLVEDLIQRPWDWPGTYARWEATLLTSLGFGLDLARCAATGKRHDLAFVSPRTGRAVSREAGGPFADRLLPLAPFLCGEGIVSMAGVRSALRMTGWFLRNKVNTAVGHDMPLPDARARLLRAFDRLELPPREANSPMAAVEPWHRRLGLIAGVA